MTAITGVHPYADKFPMLPEGELAELAESIHANGLRQPVVVTPEGLILDGRNRVAACERVGVDPTTVVYEGDDLAEYVIDSNVTRRNMSTGARAMATALVLAEAGRRLETGRWQRGSVDIGDPSNTDLWRKALAQAGIVLDYRPDLAESVVAGDLTLNAAHQDAEEARRTQDAETIRNREQAKRDAKIVADLTAADSPFLDDIRSGRMTPAVAYAAHLEDTRKERERQREIEHGWRATNLHVAEAVHMLNLDPDGFVREFLPHHDRYVVEGMRLTLDRIEAAITFLQTVAKEYTQ